MFTALEWHGDGERGARVAVVGDQVGVVDGRQDVAVHGDERVVEVGHDAQRTGGPSGSSSQCQRSSIPSRSALACEK